MKDYEKERMFWQQYTDDDLTNYDIDEINHNLYGFAKVLLDIAREDLQNAQILKSDKGKTNGQ